MMTENRDYLEMTYKSINCFADDGKLDVKELDELLSIALRDGVVDDNERRVLGNIFNRLSDHDLDTQMKEKVAKLKTEYDL